MALAAEGKLSEAECLVLSGLIREELSRRRMSRQALAEQARISVSTLEKGLSGRRPFTLATTVRLEQALGLNLRKRNGHAPAELAETSSPTAPGTLGSYSRAAVAWLEGAYLTVRPSFGDPDALYAYRTDITWDEAASRLKFRESERWDADFTQFGEVSAPAQSGHIYFVTNRHGQYRLIVVARPVITGEMHGILTTLQAGRGSHLMPVSTPIVLKPIRGPSQPSFGRISPKEPGYAEYRALLAKTLGDGFAALVGR